MRKQIIFLGKKVSMFQKQSYKILQEKIFRKLNLEILTINV